MIEYLSGMNLSDEAGFFSWEQFKLSAYYLKFNPQLLIHSSAFYAECTQLFPAGLRER